MKRKGFTLIELLAVIVILAIIAVIATPIIIGIVENARKDAFQRSVELVVSATDININDKAYEEEYTYTIMNGVISDNVAVNNTEGMNGSIIYDIEGNVKYSIHNEKWCVTKDDSGVTSITDYDGSICQLGSLSGDSCYVTEDLENGGVAIVGYLCEETDITIPDTINDKVVKAISGDAFNGFRIPNKLTSVKLPDSLESIGEYAFAYNNLSGELDLSNTQLTSIGDDAFSNIEITSVKLPDSLESIGEDAFRYNKLSGELDLSNTQLTSIGSSAFVGSDDGSKNQITSVKFPDSIESIGEYAFEYNKLSGELDLSNTQLTSIGSSAFASSYDGSTNQITSIKFPNSLEIIEGSAFDSNKLSGELDLSNTQLTSIGSFAFYDNQITSLKLPNSIESIDNAAFQYNNLSGKLDLSNTQLTSIESSAFSNNQITSLKLPNSLESINYYAFYRNRLSGELDLSNTQLTSIGYDAFSSYTDAIENQITSLKLPNSVTSIGHSAFRYNILESVTFYGRSNLDGITLGENVWGWGTGHDETNSIFFSNTVE